MADAFAASAFGLLDARSSLLLVTDVVLEQDAFFLALSCRALRDAVFQRFPPRAEAHGHAGHRFVTEDAAVLCSVARLQWARGQRWMERPIWLLEWPAAPDLCRKIANNGPLKAVDETAILLALSLHHH